MSTIPSDQVDRSSARLRGWRFPLLALVALNTAILTALPLSQARSRDTTNGELAVSASVKKSQPSPVAATPDAPTTDPRTAGSRTTSPRTTSPRTTSPQAKLSDATKPPASESTQQISDRDVARQDGSPRADADSSEDTVSPEAVQRFIASLETNDADEEERETRNQHEEVAAKDLAPSPMKGPSDAQSPTERESFSTDHPSLVLENPSNSGGAVGFLADGEECWLTPGQKRVFAAGAAHDIIFHRGGDFGEATHRLEDGNYFFEATPSGWRLCRHDGSPLASHPTGGK